MTEADCVRVVLLGFGAVHRHLCQILVDKPHLRFGAAKKQIRIVGACDSQGGVYLASGLDPASLLNCKKQHGTVCLFTADGSGKDDLQKFELPAAMVQSIPEFDVLLDASPVDLTTGGVGLACALLALSRHPPASVVFANKAPLVLQYQELHALANAMGAKILNSATVCGGLPVLNVVSRDLFGAKVAGLEGIFNSTTSYILGQMLAGVSGDEALKEAQRRGIAEADPSLDIDGFDTANKLVLIANSLGLRPSNGDEVVRLSDVSVTGIRGVTAEQMKTEDAAGRRIQLVATATKAGTGPDGQDEYNFAVAPKALEKGSFVGSFSGCDMGIAVHTDIFETILLKTNEEGVFPTAAAMLRDLNTLLS